MHHRTTGRNDEIYIHNEGRLWSAWDHYPIFASVQDKVLPKKGIRSWTGWKSITEGQSVKFKKEVMMNNDGVEEDLATIQKTPKVQKVLHRTKSQREKEIILWTTSGCAKRPRQDVPQKSRGEFSGSRLGKLEYSTWQLQYGASEEKSKVNR